MNTIKVFYTDKQVHDAASFSKSPLKPGLLARRIALDPSFKIDQNISPATPADLMLVHSPGYVKDILSGHIPNGFGNRSTKDAEAILYTVGNLLEAAEYAYRTGDPAWSLSSGFHHAGVDFAGGFCTFEALTMAAAALHNMGGGKTLIIDEDAHYGNGCVNIITMLGMPYCTYMQSRRTHARVDLGGYAEEVAAVLHSVKPDLILYQAGADNWVGDQMAGMLTMEQLYHRDIITLTMAKDHNIPIVVNLAGGYAADYDHTLAIHMNTGEALKEVYLGIEGNPLFPVHAVEIEHA